MPFHNSCSYFCRSGSFPVCSGLKFRPGYIKFRLFAGIFDDLADDLAKGVDSAKSKHLDQKITIAGTFDKEAKIDGVSEDCIVLSDGDEDNNGTIWAVCHLLTDDQREEAEEFSEGDHVVVRGTVTDINETTFFIDVDDID